MRKWLSAALAAACVFIFTSCAPQRAPEAPKGDGYETASSTITFSTSSPEENYPAENPPADAAGVVLDAPAGGQDRAVSAKAAGEVRAVWFSYLEYQTLLTGQGEAQFAKNIGDAFGKVKEAGFNTVFVQVRPYGDALYPSKLFPWSHVITGEEGKDPGFDPLAVMVREARQRDLRIEAWINPYRVRAPGGKPMCEDNPAARWLKQGGGDAVEFEGGVYLNPASEKARALIVDGVREILGNYAVDGIHFDDYFYPTTSGTFDKAAYQAYKEAAQGTVLSLANWRRENVNLLVRAVYQAVKEAGGGAVFGVSPQGNNENNYDKQYIDVAKWVAGEGYVDYLCPQVYFGYENEKAPFESTVREWDNMIKTDAVQLYVGLAPYKLGQEDEWAGSGAHEWEDTTDLLARMVESARQQRHYGGVAMFRYQFLFEPAEAVRPQVEAELANLKKVF